MNLLPKDEICQLIKRLRRQRGLSLQDVSKLTGISVSTLSKIENNLVELNYVKLITLSEALGANLIEMVAHGPPAAQTITARRSVTRRGEGSMSDAKNYSYEFLNTDIAKKHMMPVVVVLNSRTREEFGDLVAHKGESFAYILEGKVEVHTEHYNPVTLGPGDAIYLDSTMPQGFLSIGNKPARMLCIMTHAIPEDMPLEKAPGEPAARKKTKGVLTS